MVVSMKLHDEIRLHLAFGAAMLFGAPGWLFAYDRGVLTGASWGLKSAFPAFCTMLPYFSFPHGRWPTHDPPQASVAASAVRQS